MTARKCSACGLHRDRRKFPAEESINNDASRRCSDCVPKRCCLCNKTRGRRYFHSRQGALEEGTAMCHDCDRKRCASCTKLKGHMHFTVTMWQVDDGSPGLRCLECCRGKREKGFWTCANRQCRTKKPHEAFGKAIQKCGGDVSKVLGNVRVCDSCHERIERQRDEQQHGNTKFVQKMPQ